MTETDYKKIYPCKKATTNSNKIKIIHNNIGKIAIKKKNLIEKNN